MKRIHGLPVFAMEIQAAVSPETFATITQALDAYEIDPQRLILAAKDLEDMDDSATMQSREFAAIFAKGLRLMAQDPQTGLEKAPEIKPKGLENLATLQKDAKDGVNEIWNLGVVKE